MTADLTFGGPGYWLYETSGVLRPAVEAYLQGDPMSQDQIRIMRAYLRQWIAAPAWCGPMIDVLRSMIDGLRTRADIERWLDLALEQNIDPL